LVNKNTIFAMKLSFKNRKLEKALLDDKEILKGYGKMAKTVKLRMNQLIAADNLSVINSLPQLRLHQLKGDRKGEWSIDIIKNWRIIFEIDHDPLPEDAFGGVDLKEVDSIRIISVEDPH